MDSAGQGSSITIRPMVFEDVQRVHEIDVLSFSLPWSERSYRFEVTENKHAVILVAEAPGAQCKAEIVGMVVIWVILDEAHVATIAVHPDFRGEGIGRRLLAQGLLAAYDRGARLAYLEVRRSNAAARHMYEKFGYKIVGERLKYYKDNNEDALLMTLDQLHPEQLHEFSV